MIIAVYYVYANSFLCIVYYNNYNFSSIIMCACMVLIPESLIGNLYVAFDNLHIVCQLGRVSYVKRACFP